MFELEKAILITNNNRVYEKYKNKLSCILELSYEDVLIRVRDYVYNKHKLLTHPQASSLKPNQTPYRSILIYPSNNNENIDDVLLIEKCIEVYLSWQDIAKTPNDYETKVREDFKTIDLSVVDNIIDRMI